MRLRPRASPREAVRAAPPPTFAAFAAALLLLSAPTTVQAQEGWSASLGVAASRHLTHEGGPSLGAPGVELQLFAPSDGCWVLGGILAYHELGRFPNPVPGDYRDESAFVAGARLRRLGMLGPNAFGSLGAELRLAQEDPATGSGIGRDPGIGGYLGIGVMPRRAGPMGLFAELGARASLVLGEHTQGGGAYLTAVVGLMLGG